MDDGQAQREAALEPSESLLVPPGLWSEREYVDADTVLLILCDRPYEADDYIRDYGDFLAWRSDRAATKEGNSRS